MSRSDSPTPCDEIKELKLLAAKITRSDTKSESLDPENDSQQTISAAHQNYQDFARIMGIYEYLPDELRTSPEIEGIIYDLLKGKELALVDNKSVITGYADKTLLCDLLRRQLPLSFIQAVLDRPEAKDIVRYGSQETRKDLLTEFLAYFLTHTNPHDPFKGNCSLAEAVHAFTSCLSLMEQPWRELGQCLYHPLGYNGQFGDIFQLGGDILLKALMEKLGDFPWEDFDYFEIMRRSNDEPSLIETPSGGKISLPLVGYKLLSIWLLNPAIPTNLIEIFVKNMPISYWRNLRKQIHEMVDFKQSPFRLLMSMTDSLNEEEDEKSSFERIDYTLKKGIDVVTKELLETTASSNPTLYEHLLTFCDPEEFCLDPERSSAIIQFLIERGSPYDEIKTLFPLENLKKAAPMVNFSHEGLILLEIVLLERRKKGLESMVQLLLDCGSQVTRLALSRVNYIYNNDSRRKNLLELLLAPRPGVIWCQEAKQGVELLEKLINLARPVEEIAQLLEIKEAAIVRDYIGPNGESFSSLLDNAGHYLQYNNKDYAEKLIAVLVDKGALITAGLVKNLVTAGREALALQLIEQCQFRSDDLGKNPGHGSALMSRIIQQFEKPPIQPFLDAKNQEAVANMLSFDMSVNSPLAQAGKNLMSKPSKATRELVEALIQKGAIMSRAVLEILQDPIRPEILKLMVLHFNASRLYRMPIEEVHALLATLIDLKRPLDEIKKIMNFSDEKPVTAALNFIQVISRENTSMLAIWEEVYNQKSSLLSRACQWLLTDKDYALQLLDLLLDKGYRLNKASFQILGELDIPELRQEVFHRFSKHSLAYILDTEIFDIDNMVLSLTYLQAPIEWIKTILEGEKSGSWLQEDGSFFMENLCQLLTPENSEYINQIIVLFSARKVTNSRAILELLREKYACAKDLEFQNNIAAMVTMLFPSINPKIFNDDDLENTLQEIVWPRHLTRVYFQEIRLMIKPLLEQTFLFPTSLTVIVFDYFNQYSMNLIELIIKAARRNHSSSGDDFLFRKLRVSVQPDMGICAPYAAFNNLLPGALINADAKIMTDLFLNQYWGEEQKLTHPRETIIHYFLDKSVETKQGHEDGTPARMLSLFQERNFFFDLLRATQDFNQTSPLTMVPITVAGGDAKIGSADPTLQLKMIANLINLFVRFEQGKPIAYPFLVYLNNEHWLTFTWIAQKNIANVCLATDSVDRSDTDLRRIYAPIKELLSVFPVLEKQIRSILSQAYQEFTFLNKDEIEPETEILLQSQGLLECWQALAADKALRPLVNIVHFNKIVSIVASAQEMKLEPSSALKESIKKIKTHLEPPDSAGRFTLSGSLKVTAALPDVASGTSPLALVLI